MKKNMGETDIATRLIIALVFMALWGFKITSGTFAIVLLVIGGIFVLTSLTGYCPLYSILGISTCKKEQN